MGNTHLFLFPYSSSRYFPMPDIGPGTSNTKGINTGSFLGPAPSSDGEAEK